MYVLLHNTQELTVLSLVLSIDQHSYCTEISEQKINFKINDRGNSRFQEGKLQPNSKWLGQTYMHKFHHSLWVYHWDCGAYSSRPITGAT